METRSVTIDEIELATLKQAKSHNEIVRELEREATLAKAAWEDAKDESLAAKKSYDQKMNELRGMIAKGPSPQLSLFGKPTTAALTNESSEPSWADTLVSDMQFSEKMKEKLIEIGVKTLGQCETLRAGKVAGFPKGAADVGGWGPKKVTEFEDVVLAAMPIPDTDGAPFEVDDVIDDEPEAEATDDEASEDESGELKVHDGSDGLEEIELTTTIGGMEDEGLVEGAKFSAQIESTGAIVTTASGADFLVSPNEYKVSSMAEAV